MTVHLVKLAVGVDSLPRLAERQRRRLAEAEAAGAPARLRHLTRSTPRRASEILDGGSIYWVIARAIRGRQAVLGIEEAVGRQGRPRCALILDPAVVPVEARPHRAFQGWRYLEDADAPPDVAGASSGAEALPADMAEELRRLGLL